MELIDHRQQVNQLHDVVGPRVDRHGVIGISLSNARPHTGQEEHPDESDALLVRPDELGDGVACVASLNGDIG